MGDEREEEAISARSLNSTRGLVKMYRKVERMAVAVVSEPAMLNSRFSSLLVANVLLGWHDTYSWTIVSDSTSTWFNPWRTKDPIMSRTVFLSGPNLSATICFVILEH